MFEKEGAEITEFPALFSEASAPSCSNAFCLGVGFSPTFNHTRTQTRSLTGLEGLARCLRWFQTTFRSIRCIACFYSFSVWRGSQLFPREASSGQRTKGRRRQPVSLWYAYGSVRMDLPGYHGAGLLPQSGQARNRGWVSHFTRTSLPLPPASLSSIFDPSPADQRPVVASKISSRLAARSPKIISDL